MKVNVKVLVERQFFKQKLKNPIYGAQNRDILLSYGTLTFESSKRE